MVPSRRRGRSRRRYRLADTAQGIVGGVLLAGGSVVTEQAWLLADDVPATASEPVYVT